MNREDLIKEMKDAVGNKEPVEFFGKMVDAFNLLFNKIDSLESQIERVKIQSALSIEWDPKLASNMLAKQIEVLRKDRELYHNEISILKDAFMKDIVTLNYDQFCNFWLNTLGFHPFLDYSK